MADRMTALKMTRSSPYFWAILLAPVLATALFWRYGLSLTFLLYTLISLVLLLLSAIDCERLLLPDVLTLPGAVLGVGFACMLGMPLPEILLGAAVGGGGFWLLAHVFPKKLGLGDAKLMLMLGALCGLRGLPVIILIACATGLLCAALTRRRVLPFGPFLSLGSFAHMLGVRP